MSEPLDPHLAFSCLPLLWEHLRHIPLENDESKPLGKDWRHRPNSLYDLLVFSILNTSATIRGGFARQYRDNRIGFDSWVPDVIWYNIDHFHEDFDFMFKFCNGRILNWASYWFAKNKPEVLRRYLETGHYRICARCLKKWDLEAVLSDVVQTTALKPCVLESGMIARYSN